MKRLFLIAILFLALPALALDVRENTNPIWDKDPQFVREVEHGRLEKAGAGEDAIQILHLWGSPREMGKAYGTLLKEEIASYTGTVLELMTKEVGGAKEILDQVYEQTRPFVSAYFMEELEGIAEGSEQDFNTLRRVNFIGEASEWHCSLFVAWGEATASTGSLLQLRALDYAVNAEIQRYPVVVVYHPRDGHPFANFTWAGMVGAVTGMSSQQMAISEIGDNYDKENDNYTGYPFMMMLRDILQFDNTLDEAIARIQKGPRTTSLMYAVGDGKCGEGRSFQTSRTLCNVFDPENLQPLTPTHPRIKDVVYWGMSWDVPQFDKPLHDMLVKHYGKLTPEITIREILPTVRTGNLQVAVYDLTHMVAWLANAKSWSESGPLNAYERTFIRLDMKKLFNTAAPGA